MRQSRIPALLICASLATACDVEDAATGSGGGVSTSSATQPTSSASQSSSSSSQSSSSSASQSSSSSGGFTPPPFDDIPWETGAEVGFGVARKDTQNPLGSNVFIGDAGYLLSLESAQAWVRELYMAKLEALGVRWLYAVQGPNQVVYSNYEIGNTKIAAALQTQVTGDTQFIALAAHSSGSYVAHELLGQLAGGFDPSGVTDQKVVYFDLDGGYGGLTQASVARLEEAHFVAARDVATGTNSPNKGSMQNGAAAYPDKGSYAELDVSGSGCNAGAAWCVHMTLVTTKPHDPTDASGPEDYGDFVGRPVSTAWLDLMGL